MRGKIIVFEGLDGSGKATQLELLKQRLVQKGFKVKNTECPRYDKFYGKLTGRYLSGEFGPKEEISPYLACLSYALDRLNEREDILKWLEENDFVLINRYVSSNEAFFGARFLGIGERRKFIEWENVMEYDVNKLRKPHLTLFLDVSPEIGQKLVIDKGHREYMNGTGQDINERDIEFQSEVRSVYNELSNRDNWVKIECTPGGELRSINDIAEEIWKVILPLLPPKT